MLPEFPRFAPVTLDSGDELLHYTGHLPPYGDFLHAELWAFVIQSEVRLARAGGTLIMQAKDARTGVPAYSLIGGPDVGTAAATLATLYEAPRLQLVPQEIAQLLHRHGHEIEEDPGSAEYLFDTAAVVNCNGSAFRQCRQYVSRFWRYPQANTRLLNLGDRTAFDQITRLCEQWRAKSVERGKLFVPHFWGVDDVQPLLRLLSYQNHFPLISIGMFVGQDLAAFMLAALCGGKYAIVHFGKANWWDYPGSWEAVVHETARVAFAHGRTVLNFQEDLGEPTLRRAKLRFAPVGYLKKYNVQLRTDARPLSQSELAVLGC